MANISFKKFKISIDSESEKIQGLKENDIVVRQYLTKDLVNKFTVMIVDSVGIDIDGEKKSSFFIGHCIYGDEPKQNEVLDFVKVSNMSDSSRGSSIVMSSSDSNSPNISVLSDLIKEVALLHPTSIGVQETSLNHPKDILYISGSLSGSVDSKSGEFTFIKSSEVVASDPYSDSVCAKIDKYKIQNGKKYVLYFEAKSTSNLQTECRVSDSSGLRQNFKSSISLTNSWKKFLFFFDIKEEFYNNIFQVAPFGKLAINTNISLRNISITSVDSITQYFNSSKTVVGNLDGRYDSVIGKLSGYGVYTKKLIATEGAQVVGSLSVGDEFGSNNSFYVGKIAKNRFPNSTLENIDKLKFQSLSKLSEIIATKINVELSPISKCVALNVSKLETEGSFVTIPIGEASSESIVDTVSFYYMGGFDSWLCETSKVHIDEKTPSGSLVKTNTFTNSIHVGGWDRFSETIYKSSKLNKIHIRLELCIKNSVGVVYLGGIQVESGNSSTIYQETDNHISDENGYAFWASLGGIGGTIQNPLLKLYSDGSIGSRGDGFKLSPNGDAIYRGEFIVKGVDGDQTIIVGGYLNTSLISANSISADKIKVDELNAQLITVENIQGLELNFTKGTIGGWLIESNKLSSSIGVDLIEISPSVGILFKNTLSNKFGFRVGSDGNGEIGYGVISWDASGVCIGEGASLNASSIKTGSIDASIINVINLNASNISSGNISADFLSAGTIDADVISVINLNASNIKSGNISADFLSAGTIDASKISVINLNASNITAGEINGSVINIKNINADNMSSGSIVVGVDGKPGKISIFDKDGWEVVTLGKENTIAGWKIDNENIYNTTGTSFIYLNSESGIYSWNSEFQGAPFEFNLSGYGSVGYGALSWNHDGSIISLDEKVKLSWGAINNASGSRFTQIDENGIYTGSLVAEQIESGSIDASIITVKNLSADSIVSGTISSNRVVVDSNLIIGGEKNGSLDIRDENNMTVASIGRYGIRIGSKTVQDYVSGEIDLVKVGGSNMIRHTKSNVPDDYWMHSGWHPNTYPYYDYGEKSLVFKSSDGWNCHTCNVNMIGDVCIQFEYRLKKSYGNSLKCAIVNGGLYGDSVYNFTATNDKWVKVELKLKWSTDKFGFIMYHEDQNTTMSELYIRNLMVERGNVFSDWKPNQDDVESEINEAIESSPSNNFRKEYSGSAVYLGSKVRRDVVFIRDNASPSGKEYFRTKITAGEFSNIPVTDTTKWEPIGAQFESMATGLALIDQAIIDNLVTRMLSTSESGPRVQIMGSLMTVFGQYSKNIELGVDDSGMAVLKYFSNNGDLLYNLGPRGIDWGSIKPSSWTKIQLVNVISNPTDNNIPSWYSVNDVILNLPHRPGSYYWKYFAGSNPEVTPEEKEKEKYLYVSQSTSSLKISDGWYCGAWSGMYQIYYSQDSGQYIKPDGENGIYENINGVVDLSPIYTVQLTLYRGGKIVRNANVYWSGAKPQ